MEEVREKNFFKMENPHQKTDYVVYHAYLLKHIINNNMDIFPIQNRDTRKFNTTE